MADTTVCLFCRIEGASREHRHGNDTCIEIRCRECGTYMYAHRDVAMSCHTGFRPYEIAALLYERGEPGLDADRPFIQFRTDRQYPHVEGYFGLNVTEFVRKFPRTVTARLRRCLLGMAKRITNAAGSVDVNPRHPWRSFASDESEAATHLQWLTERSHIAEKSRHSYGLTEQGWKYVEDAQSSRSDARNPAFVAMWFGDTTDRDTMTVLFDTGIEPAVRSAGYACVRSDRTEHNDWIMDRIIADIMAAPFVVADFTGNAHGVYFEAGLARGRGIPVIQTCRQDSIDELHFDTSQINTIAWSDADDLAERLFERIRATIGKGPFEPAGNGNMPALAPQ